MLKKTKLSSLLILAASSLAVAACGSTGVGLIPAGKAGPLQQDFEQVVVAAREGEGNCGPTKTALEKTQKDFEALPSSVDAGLRIKLAEGISNLKVRALALCAQPGTASATATSSREPTSSISSTTSSKTTSSSESTSETSSSETSSSTSTSETTSSSSTPPPEQGNGGGTPAPEGSVEENPEKVGGAVP